MVQRRLALDSSGRLRHGLLMSATASQIVPAHAARSRADALARAPGVTIDGLVPRQDRESIAQRVRRGAWCRYQLEGCIGGS